MSSRCSGLSCELSSITAVDFAGNESDPAEAMTPTGIGDSPTPQRFALHQNVPNPFNPTTTIRYDVPPAGGHVIVRVYDVQGQLVRTLVDANQTGGQKRVTWDGRNDRGQGVSTGIYFCQLRGEGFVKTHKMVLMK